MKRKYYISSIFLITLFLPICSSFVSGYQIGLIKASQTSIQEIVGFSRNLLLSTDDTFYAHHVEVSMAISDNGIIFAGWKNAETHYGSGVRVSIVQSQDNGQTWTSPYNMPMYQDLDTHQSDPWLYWFNGTLYFAYLEFESRYFNNPLGYLSQITIAKSTDYGQSWKLVNATNNTYFADKETFIVGNNNIVYLVYDDVDVTVSNGNATVRMCRSVDGGDSYQEVSTLGEDEYYIGPYVALNSTGEPHVAWSWIPDNGGNLLFSKSLDGGFTFSEPKMVNTDGNYSGYGTGRTTLPLIKFDHNNRLYLLWADEFSSNWDVWLRYSDNFGKNWSDRILINPSILGHQWNPDMVIDSDNILHIVYYSEYEAFYRPYYRTLNFTGENRDIPMFSDQIVIADDDTPNYFYRPGEYFAIQLDNNRIPHIAWTDGRNNELDIYYAYGLTEPTQSLFFTPEMITTIIIISVTAFAALIIIIARKFYNVPVEIKEKWKMYRKTYKHYCDKCQNFTTVHQYCEHCGEEKYVRAVKREDFKNHLFSDEESPH